MNQTTRRRIHGPEAVHRLGIRHPGRRAIRNEANRMMAQQAAAQWAERARRAEEATAQRELAKAGR